MDNYKQKNLPKYCKRQLGGFKNCIIYNKALLLNLMALQFTSLEFIFGKHNAFFRVWAF